jgi:hypothetical protein
MLKELMEREGMTGVNVRQASHVSWICKGRSATRAGMANALQVRFGCMRVAGDGADCGSGKRYAQAQKG